MSTPTLHDLEFFRKAFPEILLPDSWRISTSKSDDVVWNVVLAYLNSFLLSDENELTRRMQCLTGHQQVNANIKLSIETCNPFLDRDASFCDKEISELVGEFKARVECYIKNDERLFHLPDKNFGYIEASSIILSCNIVLISVPLEDKLLVNVFPVPDPRNPRKPYEKHISLFNVLKSVRGNEIMQYQFSFHIPEGIGRLKQREALRKIFNRPRSYGSKDSFDKIAHLPDTTENFFVKLAKTKFWREIPIIYGNPDMLSKIANVGLDTDPRRKDVKGKSPLFYALKAANSRFVSIVYDHIANPCLQTDTPSTEFVEILLSLREDFKLLEKDLKSVKIKENSRCLLEDLCRFNEFQLEMLKTISNLKLRINCCDRTEKEYQNLQRKETTLIIIKSFENHIDNFPLQEGEIFKYRKKEGLCKEEVIKKGTEFYKKGGIKEEDISLFEVCFSKLEFSLASMVIDNLFFLKEWLEIPNNAYLEVESDFFRFVFLKKFLENYNEKTGFYLVSRWIISQERLSLKRNLGELKEILQKMEFSRDNIVDKLPEAAVLTLTEMPQFYGQFLIFRLQHYLNAATELTVKDLKSILVIERCLQVLGECCKESDFNSVQSILTSALPKNFIIHLRQICYSLDHFKPLDLFHRQILEEDELLFIEIRNELIKVKNLLSFIFSAHNVELSRFLFKYFSESIDRAERRSITRENSTYFVTMRNYLIIENNRLNRKENRKVKPSATRYKSRYKYIVQNMISAIREVLKHLKAPVPEKATKEVIKELDSQFWCLEILLAHITTGEMHNKTLELRVERNSLFAELTEEAYQFQKINKPANSITDISPLWKEINYLNRCRRINDENKVEREEIGKQLPSESKGIHDNKQQNVNSIPENIFNVKHDLDGNRYSQLSIHTEEVAAKFLSEYEKMTYSLFLGVSNYYKLNFEKIKNYCLVLEGKKFLTEREKYLILNSIPEKIRIKQRIQDICEQKVELSNTSEDKNVKVYSKNMQTKEMKRNSNEDLTCLVAESRDYLTDLQKRMENQEIDKSECELLCRELEIPDNAKDVLLKLVPTEKKKGNQFEFLRNRIKTLKNILIDDNKDIQQLWESATTKRKKIHMKEKIVQRFLNDSVIQASVEMLLSDCKNILRSKGLKQLWKRMTNLFNDINLRNVLVPDCIPQLKSLGRFLDPYDLASEIVENLLKLLADEYVLDCMQQILEQSGTYFSDFMQIMDDDKNEEFKILREKILNCDHWEEYALLIPFR